MRLLRFIRNHLELLVWSGGLVVLALMDPGRPPLFDFCLFKRLGVPFCPGCGLGRSISFFLHGNVQQSLQTHPLGILATVILAGRIAALLTAMFVARRRSPLSSPS